MLDWLLRLLDGKPRAAGGGLADRASVASAPPVAAPASSAPPTPVEAHGPQAWAAVLGIDPAAFDAADAPLAPEEEALAQAVLAHFDTHRPGPASFPAISMQVYDVAQDPDAEIGRLAGLIELDAALTAGVLVLANSPIHRGVDRVETTRQAIARLGTTEVARLATALSTRSLFRPEVRAEFRTFGATWNGLFYHSVVTARTATGLGASLRTPGADQAYVGGMLHDVGKSIALRSLAALVLDRKVAAPAPEVVARLLHRVHVQVGSEVHREWRLPGHLTVLAARHHERTIPAGRDLAPLHLVRLASALSLLRAEPGLHPAAPAEAVDSARALGLDPLRLAELRVELAEQEEWVRLLFGDEAGGPSAAR